MVIATICLSYFQALDVSCMLALFFLVGVTDTLGASDNYDTLRWGKTAVHAIQQHLMTLKIVVGTRYWSYFEAMDVSCMLASHFDG